MAMTLKPPRTSALGLAWSENFRRGYAGVAKNGGTIAGTVPIAQGWASFSNNIANRLVYPHQCVGGLTELSLGYWLDAFAAAGGAFQCPLAQQDGGATAGFAMSIDQAAVYLRVDMVISGTNRALLHNPATLPLSIKQLVVVTWKTADYIRMYVNGAQVAVTGATYAGTITDANSLPLYTGSFSAASYPCNGKVADPFIIGRQLSASEVADLYANRTLR